MILPDDIWSKSAVSQVDWQVLDRDLASRAASTDIRQLFWKRARLKLDVRLGVNIRTLVGLLIYHDHVKSILNNGITKKEREALVFLEQAGVSIENKETAHGLLNIHERYLVLKRIRGMFTAAKMAAKDEYPLDEILGV